uniref:Uncharacterized protein n=1 Tax=Lepeophtheirus salmonis TaxID=72036 RepID=A0A0K2TKU2_LEPSM
MKRKTPQNTKNRLMNIMGTLHFQSEQFISGFKIF